MTLAQWLVSPFLDYGFMRRALAGACALSLGAAPLGAVSYTHLTLPTKA